MGEIGPRVSIGMPLFNGEKYLAETLDSLLAQTYPDFELIISDNASTDGSREICEKYKAMDERIHYQRNPVNLGAAPNYVNTFERASGEFFKWAAYDDPCAARFLERCVQALDEAPEAIMAYPRTILIDAYGQVIEYHSDGFDLRSSKAYQRFRQSFRSSAWCHPVYGLIRTSALRRTALLGNYASSDKVLLGELALLGQCHEVPEHLAYRRLHAENSTTANLTDEAMALWFDTATGGRVLAPRLRRFVEHHRAIARAPMSSYERIRCYAELWRFYLAPGRLPGALIELRTVGRAALQVLLNRKSSRRRNTTVV